MTAPGVEAMAIFYPAARYDAEELTTLLNGCYEGYFVPIRYQPHEYEYFVRVHDVDLAHSLVAELEGRAVGVAQLSRRGTQGWVAGVGVLAEARRRGIARQMMQGLSLQAAAAGVHLLRLEVLTQNQPALALYLDLGWQIERELWVWRLPAVAAQASAAELAAADPEDLLAASADWLNPPPCWQRQPATLRRYRENHLQGWRWPAAGRLQAGALGFLPRDDRMRLADVSLHPNASPLAAQELLTAIHLRYPAASLHLLNEPAESPLTPALQACGGEVVQRQYEMSLRI